jgi:uncharacterized Zn finger protein
LEEQLPDNLELILEESGLSLFPNIKEGITAGCNCPDWTNPCRHTAAIFYFIAFLICRYPIVILSLRGKKRTELLEMILELRRESITKRQLENDHEKKKVFMLPKSLCLETEFPSFWGDSTKIKTFFSSEKSHKQPYDKINDDLFVKLNVGTLNLAKLLQQSYQKTTEQIKKLI